MTVRWINIAISRAKWILNRRFSTSAYISTGVTQFVAQKSQCYFHVLHNYWSWALYCIVFSSLTNLAESSLESKKNLVIIHPSIFWELHQLSVDWKKYLRNTLDSNLSQRSAPRYWMKTVTLEVDFLYNAHSRFITVQICTTYCPTVS